MIHMHEWLRPSMGSRTIRGLVGYENSAGENTRGGCESRISACFMKWTTKRAVIAGRYAFSEKALIQSTNLDGLAIYTK